MWCPDRVDYIEFNVFPDDPDFTSPRSPSRHRSSLIAAAWVKGGDSTIYNIDPVRKSYSSFYDENIQISPHELLEVLKHAGNDIISRNFDTSSYKFHPHKIWQSKGTDKRFTKTEMKKNVKRLP